MESVQYLSPVNWLKKRNNLFITLFKNNSINIYVKITKQSEIRLTFKTRYSNKANLYDFYPPPPKKNNYNREHDFQGAK